MRKMKTSLEQWLGELPESWGLLRIASLYKIRNIKVSDKDYMPLSVTMNGIVPQLETAAKTNAHDDRKLVRKGDFAINSRSDRRGSCGISEYDGSVSLINTILAPLGEMNPNYYNWLFHTTQFADEFYKWGHGIVDDLWTTGWQDMKKIMIPVPPLQEQNEISDFLNAKCTEIDALVADIQAQIETLEQYKRSIISETVTKGLNQNVQMKDSGIECIGDIPSDWNIKRVKHIAISLSKGNGITRDDVKEDGNIQCIRYGEIYSKYENSFKECISYTNLESIESPKFAFYGDILFAATGELIEEIGKNIVYLGTSPGLVGGDIIIMRHNQNPSFLNYALNSNYAQMQKSRGKAKLKVVHISASDIGNIRLALPPIREQEAISNFLDTKCSEINEIVMKREEQLEVLKEYKKSLIYEYVTGKKEVPAIWSD